MVVREGGGGKRLARVCRRPARFPCHPGRRPGLATSAGVSGDPGSALRAVRDDGVDGYFAAFMKASTGSVSETSAVFTA
jgi:hypothetical protein